ncbi:hypothetical protein ACDF64_10950 [Agromyces sp. MMS24-JH15]|uniref:hypothetical protein n=1 Tax=Agromyces sp. MMS24-JH15 TaxID=3243765 RepID=UPI003748FC49
MSRPRPRPRTASARRSTMLVVGGTAVLLGVAAVLIGWSPALLVASVLGVLTIAVAQRASFALAFAASTLFLLAVHLLLSRLSPVVGWDYGLTSLGGLALVAVFALGWIARPDRGREPRLPGRAQMPTSIATLLLPVLTLGFWVVALGWGPRMRVGWILANDAVWNTMSARFIVTDGGIDPAAHPNPAASTAALAATWMIPGRSWAGELLRHDVAREAQLVLLLVLACAVFASLIATRMVPRAHPLLGIAAGFAAGGLMLGWYVLGFTAELGFLNAPAAVVLLLASWLCFAESPRSPALAGSALLLAATLLLGTWAPLVVVPLALVAIVGARHWRRAVARRGLGLLVLAAAGAQFAVYVAFVTLADLRTTGGALAADGAAPPVEPRDVAAVVALTLVAVVGAAVTVRLRRSGESGGTSRVGPAVVGRGTVLGIAAVVAAAAVGCGYLAWQRVSSGLGWWGYYPAKFSWLVCVLLLVVAIGMIAAAVSRLRVRPARRIALIVGAGLVGATVMMSLPLGGVGRLVAPVALATDGQFAARNTTAERLFAVADGGRTIALRSGAPAADDALVNSWLLQSYSDRSEDPVRIYAYGLDPANLDAICDAVKTWGGGVRILTADTLLADELGATCPDAGYEVVVSS